MKTGYYLAGRILLFNAGLVGLFGLLRLLGVISYEATHQSNLFLFTALLFQILFVILGWALVLESSPKESSLRFEKWLARKFGKTD
jgi:hypothetical protein